LKPKELRLKANLKEKQKILMESKRKEKEIIKDAEAKVHKAKALKQREDKESS
jgi:hypothetical protein